MIRRVKLYGALGKKFGKVFRLDVASAAEAVRALCVQIPGLRAAVEAGRYYVNVGEARGTGLAVSPDTLRFNLPAGDIHVVPAVRGRAGKGMSFGKIILGSLLIAASFFVPVGFTGIVASLGITMALSGVSGLLASKKKKQPEKKSYMDQGKQTGGQGGCVPLIVGRFMVTPLVVSAGVSVSDSNGLNTALAT